MYPDRNDYDPHAAARVSRVDTGITEVPMGREGNFRSNVDKSYEAIIAELGDLRASIIETRHKLIGPVPTKHPDPQRGVAVEPSDDMGVLNKIEYANSRIYSDVTDLAGLMRDLTNRI